MTARIDAPGRTADWAVISALGSRGGDRMILTVRLHQRVSVFI